MEEIGTQICTDGRPCEDTRRRWPSISQEETSGGTNLLTALISSSQNYEKIKFHCWSHPVCVPLLWQPKHTNELFFLQPPPTNTIAQPARDNMTAFMMEKLKRSGFQPHNTVQSFMTFHPSTHHLSSSMFWRWLVGMVWGGLSLKEKERLFYKFIFERKSAVGSEILDFPYGPTS